DLFKKLTQGNDIAAALGNFYYFTAAPQCDHLVDDYLQSVRVDAERADNGLEAGDMALVVSAPDVDDGIELTLDKFIIMVGDIGGKVGGGAVAADDDIVLVLAESGGDEPGRAFFFGDVAA